MSNNYPIKRRVINRKTGEHGIRLTYKQFLIKVDEIIDKYWNIQSITNQKIDELEEELHDMAYAYNIRKYPIKKTDEPGKWIIGFESVGFDVVTLAFAVNFELMDFEE